MNKTKELEDEILNEISGGHIEEANEDNIKILIRLMKKNPLTSNKKLAVKIITRSFTEGGWEKFATTNSEEDKEATVQLLLDEWDK